MVEYSFQYLFSFCIFYFRVCWTKLLEDSVTEPVADQLFSAGSQYGLRMKLHSPHIEGPVAKGHDVAFVAGGGHFQTVGQVFPVNYP